MTDPEALQRFAAENAHDAFAHLVGKYAHFVYSAAFRQLRDTTLADQATQATSLPLRAVAEALKLDDVAAGQQINRGVARLRKYFEAKNVFIPAEALVASLQAHAVRDAAPSVAYNAVTAALAPPGQSGAIEFL